MKINTEFTIGGLADINNDTITNLEIHHIS